MEIRRMDKEIHIKFENGSEIKAIPYSDNVRGVRGRVSISHTLTQKNTWMRYASHMV
jgi:hypothetical protein